MDELGQIVDMRVNEVSACALLRLRGCEHNKDVVKKYWLTSSAVGKNQSQPHA